MAICWYLFVKILGGRLIGSILIHCSVLIIATDLVTWFQPSRQLLPSLKPTCSYLKMDGWETTSILGRPSFRCELLVSGRVVKIGSPLYVGLENENVYLVMQVVVPQQQPFTSGSIRFVLE